MLCIDIAIYFGYIRSHLSDKYLCHSDNQQLYDCPNSDIRICAKKGVDITTFCGKEQLKQIVGNPGCSPDLQKICTDAGSIGACLDNPICCACDDYEGEGCVPKNCAKEACINSKCD